MLTTSKIQHPKRWVPEGKRVTISMWHKWEGSEHARLLVYERESCHVGKHISFHIYANLATYFFSHKCQFGHIGKPISIHKYTNLICEQINENFLMSRTKLGGPHQVLVKNKPSTNCMCITPSVDETQIVRLKNKSKTKPKQEWFIIVSVRVYGAFPTEYLGTTRERAYHLTLHCCPLDTSPFPWNPRTSVEIRQISPMLTSHFSSTYLKHGKCGHCPLSYIKMPGAIFSIDHPSILY